MGRRSRADVATLKTGEIERDSMLSAAQGGLEMLRVGLGCGGRNWDSGVLPSWFGFEGQRTANGAAEESQESRVEEEIVEMQVSGEGGSSRKNGRWW